MTCIPLAELRPETGESAGRVVVRWYKEPWEGLSFNTILLIDVGL